MEYINIISSITGVVTILAFIIFSFIIGLKNLYFLIFKPSEYIQANHGDVLNKILQDHFRNDVNKLIHSSIKETLKETGMLKQLDRQKSIFMILTKQYLEHEIKDKFKDYRLRLLNIIKTNASEVSAKIGKATVSEYNFYVNLRHVLPNSLDATELSYILAGFIYSKIEENNSHYDYVAVNRNGNTILGYLISNFLNIPLLIVNYDSRWVVDGKNVKVNGIEKDSDPSGKRVFLVDDAVSGGTILKESCNVLQEYGFIAQEVYILFSRKEDGAIKEYKNNDITLFSIFDLGDEEIRLILNTNRDKLSSLLELDEFK